MARYRNISRKAEYICVNMSKTLIQPGEIADLSLRDLHHCGSALRYFESVDKSDAVINERMLKLNNSTEKGV